MSENWISARDALSMVSPRYARTEDAEIAIYRHCEMGEIKTNAKLLTFRLKGPKTEKPDIKLPDAFWGAMVAARLREDWTGSKVAAPWQDWEIGGFSVVIDGVAYSACGVTFDHEDIGRMLSAGLTAGKKDLARLRSPTFKRGRPPDDDAILAKCEEMHLRGMDTYNIAKSIRFESGFANVSNVHVRNLIRGRYKSGPRMRAE